VVVAVGRNHRLPIARAKRWVDRVGSSPSVANAWACEDEGRTHADAHAIRGHLKAIPNLGWKWGFGLEMGAWAGNGG
jgi:hypothetical protein